MDKLVILLDLDLINQLVRDWLNLFKLQNNLIICGECI